MPNQLQNGNEPENSVGANANSSANAGNNNTDENGIYFGDSKLQTEEEYNLDKKGDHSKEENSFSATAIDNFHSESNEDDEADRAGTAERKEYGDTELNKGLEAQARMRKDSKSFSVWKEQIRTKLYFLFHFEMQSSLLYLFFKKEQV